MSDNISVFEEYLFAADKTQLVESYKNSSDIKKHMRLCHLLARGGELTPEDVTLLEHWKRYNSHGDKGSLVVKHMLAEIAKEEDNSKRQTLMQAFNQKYLGFSFNDSRQAAGNQTQTHQEDGAAISLKTALTQDDHEEMKTATKVKELLNSQDGHISFNLNELGTSILSTINFADVKSWAIKENLFSTLSKFSNNEVVSI